MSIQIDKLKKALPIKVSVLVDELLESYPDITKLQLAHLLGQCSYESQRFLSVRENLNYSAKALMAVFESHFPNLTIAKQYERKPEAIANYVYANREGNGDVHSGDGFKYRGTGYIGLTFKNNINDFIKWAHLAENTTPDEIADKYPLLSAHYFFSVNHIYALCRDTSRNTTLLVTHKINKSNDLVTIGFDTRLRNTQNYFNLMQA